MKIIKLIFVGSIFLLMSSYQLYSQYTISGNAGVAGATLRYTIGNPRTALSDIDGNYSFVVPSGFSGTVTPFKKNYAFTPANVVYTDVTLDQLNQDYIALESISAPTVWDGPRTVVFTKANFADWTLASNQDQIMSDVWITRGNTQGIFNVAQESAYQTGSPAGTRWAEGLIADYSSLTYTTGLTIPGGSLVGKNLVMHLINEDIYVDVKFLSFTGGTSGGGFSYERSDAPASVSVRQEIKVSFPKVFMLGQNYPNPFNPTTTIEFTLAEDSKVSLKVFDILGHEVAVLVNEELKAGVLHRVQFNASKLSSGIYFYRLDTGKNQSMKKLILLK
jgi:hypothetical protein